MADPAGTCQALNCKGLVQCRVQFPTSMGFKKAEWRSFCKRCGMPWSHPTLSKMFLIKYEPLEASN